jgi:hypothetical protein
MQSRASLTRSSARVIDAFDIFTFAKPAQALRRKERLAAEEASLAQL